MAGAPQYKVFDAAGKYQAAVKEPEAGAALMSLYGDGATIRMGHSKKNTLWTEGSETQPAAESWDFCAATCLERREVIVVDGWRSLGVSEEKIAEWLEGGME